MQLILSLFLHTETTIRNDLDVSLSLQTATVVLTALVKLVESSFFDFPIEGTVPDR